MSEAERLVNACTNCDSSQVQTHGTNIRAKSETIYYRCRSCGTRMDEPNRRPPLRDVPDKPPTGFARRVWEMAEKEADDE